MEGDEKEYRIIQKGDEKNERDLGWGGARAYISCSECSNISKI
jgi:hypothetical protein